MGVSAEREVMLARVVAWDYSSREDYQVRCVEAPTVSQNKSIMSEENDLEALKASIKAAEKDVDLAERNMKNKKLRLQSLQKQLQDTIIAGIGGLKIKEGVQQEVVKKPEAPIDEATRKANVRRRWRILGMKIKFGLGAQLAVKKRNLKDSESFIDKESEEACKEDQLDLEGKCMRKKMDKRHFRRGGIMVGSTQGRDGF